jgi:hypothetical protein
MLLEILNPGIIGGVVLPVLGEQSILAAASCSLWIA